MSYEESLSSFIGNIMKYEGIGVHICDKDAGATSLKESIYSPLISLQTIPAFLVFS